MIQAVQLQRSRITEYCTLAGTQWPRLRPCMPLITSAHHASCSAYLPAHCTSAFGLGLRTLSFEPHAGSESSASLQVIMSSTAPIEYCSYRVRLLGTNCHCITVHSRLACSMGPKWHPEIRLCDCTESCLQHTYQPHRLGCACLVLHFCVPVLHMSLYVMKKRVGFLRVIPSLVATHMHVDAYSKSPHRLASRWQRQYSVPV